MQTDRRSANFTLAKGGSVTLTKGHRVEIACSTGSLWITEDNNIRDVVIGPGERVTFDGSGAVLVHALHPTTLTTTTLERVRSPFWKALDQAVRRATASFGVHRPVTE